MKKSVLSLFSVSLCAMMPVLANAAGTYYNGNMYQSAQRYGSNAGGGYYNTYGAGRGYGQNQSMMVRNTRTTVTKKSNSKQTKNQAQSKQGFQLSAGLAHEFANWNIEMKNAGSKLRYDGLDWNVISGEGVYYFGSSTPMQIKVGARYGKQFGETSMIDDDITNGGYGYQDWTEGRVTGYAMSLGTSKDGTQYGFNAAFGLTDFFNWGRVKVTPSIGYRYFKHELITKDNSGLTTDVFLGNSSHPYVNCISVGGETQCDPFVLFEFFNASGASLGTAVTGREQVDLDGDGIKESLTDIVYGGIPAGATTVAISMGDTYYYAQMGTSHKYETLWQGPYVALDMEYMINNNNFVNAGVELGLPMYDSKGDQPYRIDWAHPTSVEDEAGFGKAYHLGLNAMWSTAVTDSVMLSLGMTYDYYRVGGADATTYLNPGYYQPIADSYAAKIAAGGLTDTQIAAYQAEIDAINAYKNQGWKIESKDEVKSIYSSMGIRLGLNVKF